MNRRNDHDTGQVPDSESKRLRSLFEAAADPAPPLEAPPFFASRIRALAGEAGGATTRSPLALAAARLLPVFTVVAMLLVAAAGYEYDRRALRHEGNRCVRCWQGSFQGLAKFDHRGKTIRWLRFEGSCENGADIGRAR